MIGKLKQRITLQRPVLVPDEAGGFARTWQDMPQHPVVYADISTVSAGERLRLGRLESGLTHRIRLRARADIRPDMRILWGERILEIASVHDITHLPGYMEIAATEKMGA